MAEHQLPTGFDFGGLDRKIRILSLPELTNVKTVKTAYKYIIHLLDYVIARERTESDPSVIGKLQRRHIDLEKQKVRYGEFLDSKGVYLFASSASLKERIQIDKTKVELRSRLEELNAARSALLGQSRGSLSPGTGISASETHSIGPNLLDIILSSPPSEGVGSQHSSRVHPDSSAPDGQSFIEKSAVLFQTSHQLLLHYEQLIKSIYQKHAVAEARESLEPILTDLKKQAAQVITGMRRLLGSPLPVHKPRSSLEACLGCRSINDLYCENCKIRFERQCEKLALKSCGNKLLILDNLKTRATTEHGSLEPFLLLEDLKAAVLAKEQKAAELSKKIATVKASIAAKRTQLEERDKLIARLADSNCRLKAKINGRNSTLLKVEDAARQARHSKDLKETQLAALRRDKIHQLFSIMPLLDDPTQPSQKRFLNTVVRDDCTVEPPNPATKDPELPAKQLAAKQLTAVILGALVRLLKILGKYLNVHYPFPMSFNGSQSVIWRFGSPNRYVLSEIRAASLDEFGVALHRLHWNVYYLCFSQGLSIQGIHAERPALRNLRLLLQHSNLMGFELRTPERFLVLVPDKHQPVVIAKAPASPMLFSGSGSTAFDSGISTPAKPSEASSTPNSRRQSFDTPNQSESIQDETEDGDAEFDDFEIVQYQPPRPDDPDALRHHDRALADQDGASSSNKFPQLNSIEEEKDDVYML